MIKEDIDVQPTKELFIYMLTRDVKLEKAIIDLIDNSIDAAINNAIEDDLSAFNIYITLNKDTFSIEDNCGGIDIDIAKEYAFKFGRPDNIDKKVGNIGQFGIGMKRTIFKLGKICQIKSQSINSKFSLDIDIDDWTSRPTDWSFELNSEIFTSQIQIEDTYTKIEVTSLNNEVSDSFLVQNFITELRLEIEEAHAYTLAKGLNIFVNKDKLTYHIPTLKNTDKVSVFMKKITFDEGSDTEVEVTIYAGLSDRELTEAGWYIYCNNRLILSANQKMTTGWESNGIRKFHPDFAYFRGYVFFESQNGDKLPWTTTKDGINFDSEIYQNILLEMQNSIKPILGFLSDLARENTLFNKDPEEIERKLYTEIERLLEIKENNIDIRTIKCNQEFVAPILNVKSPRKIGTITYSRPLEELNNIKKYFGVATNKEIGEMSYRYLIENEMDE